MSQPTSGIFLNSTEPPAPAENQNAVPQSDGGVPLQSITFYPQAATDTLLGVIKPDGVTTSVAADGTLSASAAGDANIIQAIQQQQYVFAVDSGNANAYLVDIEPPPAVVPGSLVIFLATNANTGASTLSISTSPITTTAAITKNGTAPLIGGEILAGQIMVTIFDGTNFQIVGGSSSAGVGGTGPVGTALPDVIPTGAIDGVNTIYTIPSDVDVPTAPVSAVVQAVSGYNDGGNMTLTFASPNTSGGTIMVEFFSSGTLPTISDTNGNAYTEYAAEGYGANNIGVFIATNVLAGANSITIAFSAGYVGQAANAIELPPCTVDSVTTTFAAGSATSLSVGPVATTGLNDWLQLTIYGSPKTSSGCANDLGWPLVADSTGTYAGVFSYGAAVLNPGNYSNRVTFPGVYGANGSLIALKGTFSGGSGGSAQGHLYKNGVLQNPLGVTPDYTLVGTIITMANAPVILPRPDWLLWIYS